MPTEPLEHQDTKIDAKGDEGAGDISDGESDLPPQVHMCDEEGSGPVNTGRICSRCGWIYA